MTARVLPVEEWHRMDESLDPILAGLSPIKSRVCVVEEDGEIVARVLLFPVLHAECLWVAPSKRKKGSALRRLWELTKRQAVACGFDRVWGASDSEHMTRLLAHPKLGGIPIPALSVVLPCEGRN